MRKIRFALHNIIVHPICGVLWLVGFEKLPDWMHENLI